MARTNARLVLGGAGVIGVLAAGILVATTRGAAPTEPPPLGPASGRKGEHVWDGGVRFELGSIQCGTGPTGDSDTRGIRPDGMHCWTEFSVLNESAEEVLLPWASQRLVTDEGSLEPSETAMEAILLDEPGSIFDFPIPPGGGGTGRLVFDVPLGAERREVVLHAAEGSPGARVVLDGCHFSRTGGGCYVAGGRTVEPGVAYPFTISGPRGGMALLYVCFDERQWEVVEPHPTSGMPEDFTGHGVMTLAGSSEALFEDNSGRMLALEPTGENDERPSVCG